MAALKSESDRTDFLSALSWAIGRFVPATMLKIFAFFLFFYLVYIAKLSPALAGTVIFVSRIVDIFVSPAIGVWSDTLQTRWGRRRPVMLVGGIVGAFACQLLFNVPHGLAEGGRLLFLMLAMVLFTIGYGLINIPLMAMSVEMCPDPADRRRVIAYGMIFTTVGFLAGGAAFPYLVKTYGEGAAGYGAAGDWLGGSVLIVVLLCVLGTYRARFVTARQARIGWRDAADVLRNAPMRAYTACDLLTALTMASQAALILFVIQGLMKLPVTMMAIATAAGTATQLVFIPLWAWAARRVGSLRTLVMAYGCGVVFSMCWLFPTVQEPPGLFAARYLFFGLFVSGASLSGMAIKADIAEYGNIRSGRRREGLYTAVFNLVEKSAGAFGILVSGFILSLAGFDRSLPPTADQGPGARVALYLGVSIFPVLGLIGGALIALRYYKLDDERLKAARQAAHADALEGSREPDRLAGAATTAP